MDDLKFKIPQDQNKQTDLTPPSDPVNLTPQQNNDVPQSDNAFSPGPTLEPITPTQTIGPVVITPTVTSEQIPTQPGSETAAIPVNNVNNDQQPAQEKQTPPDLPPVMSPPPKKSKKIIAALIALFFLAISIPAEIVLVNQSQILEKKAFDESTDCNDHGGFAGYGEDTDCGRMQPTGEIVKIARCNDGATLPLEPTGRPGSCNAGNQPPQQQTQCTRQDNGQKYNPGGKYYSCTGNKASCRGEAGEGIPNICNADGGWSTMGSECTNECPVADKSDCEYREDCTTKDGKSGNRLCSGKKNSEGVCKYDEKVSSCQMEGSELGCTANPIQSCKFNKNYQSGMISGKPNPDPNCGANGGIYCNDGGNFNACCYPDGNCYKGTQENACKDLGNGVVQINQSTSQLNEYYCPDQKSAGGSCSANIRSLGPKGPGTYTVGTDRGCGGYQIDAAGLCGSYTFKACPPPASGAPSFTSQCLDVRFYDASGARLTNPATQVKSGDKVRIAVSGSTNEPGGLSKARFKVNDGSWEESAVKNTSGEYYADKTVTAGPFRVEAQVFNPALGWK